MTPPMELFWDEPPARVRGAIVLQHGFARRPGHLTGLAGYLASRGYLVVRPYLASLRPWRSLQDSGFADQFGAGVLKILRQRTDAPVVVMGHSAGAAVVAGWWRLPHAPERFCLLDPVDRHRRITGLAEAVRTERAQGRTTPAIGVVSADPSACNRHAAAVQMLAAADVIRDGSTWWWIRGSAHADPERIPASGRATDVGDADRLARLACGRGGSSDQVVQWAERIMGWLEQPRQIEPPS
jgi:alpha-beta hydrolase superfamily lysophospholipase